MLRDNDVFHEHSQPVEPAGSAQAITGKEKGKEKDYSQQNPAQIWVYEWFLFTFQEL